MPRHITVELKCHYCGESLSDESHPVDGNPGIKLKASSGGKSFFVWLSSVFGSNNLESEAQFKKGDIVEFACPHCSAPQTSNKKCDMCGAPVALFKLADGGKVRVCTRSGCKNIWLDF